MTSGALARALTRLPATMARPLTLLLVRHGQSEWNAAGLLQGQTAHVPLTELGHAQAAAAARELVAPGPGAPLTSAAG